jgi:hypothetical protein
LPGVSAVTGAEISGHAPPLDQEGFVDAFLIE